MECGLSWRMESQLWGQCWNGAWLNWNAPTLLCLGAEAGSVVGSGAWCTQRCCPNKPLPTRMETSWSHGLSSSSPYLQTAADLPFWSGSDGATLTGKPSIVSCCTFNFLVGLESTAHRPLSQTASPSFPRWTLALPCFSARSTPFSTKTPRLALGNATYYSGFCKFTSHTPQLELAPFSSKGLIFALPQFLCSSWELVSFWVTDGSRGPRPTA